MISLSILLLGCTDEALDTGAEEVEHFDARPEIPDPPEGGMQILMPPMLLQAYEQVTWCFYGTFDWGEAEAMGVNFYQPVHSEAYNHHNRLKQVQDDDYPDDALTVCPEANMRDYLPFFEPVLLENQGVVGNWLNMPDGFAVRMPSGQRWTLESHYINPTDEDVLVQSAINLGLVATEDVTTWVNAYQFTKGELDLPPGEDTSESFDCSFDDEVYLVSMTGHMHEYGSAYTVDWVHDDITDRVYEVSNWLPDFRDQPIVNTWGLDQFRVDADDHLTTTCSWFNETGDTLTYPDEMCTTGGMAYPLEAPVNCVGNRR